MLEFAQKQRSTRGVSLTETAIVLGVVGAVLGSIWVMAAGMRNSVRQNDFSDELRTIVDNIRGNYAGKAYFDTTTMTTMMTTLKARNVFPGSTVQPSVTRVTTPFGVNTLSVCGWRATGSTNCSGAAVANVPLFAIEVRFANMGDCVQAVMRNSNPLTQPGLVDVYINGTGRVAANNSLPWTLATAITNCTGATSAAPKAVDYVYRLVP
jgi:hypothetical protein